MPTLQTCVAAARHGLRAACLVSVLNAWGAIPAGTVPAPGDYAAQLCVAVAQAPARCGAVEFQLQLAGRAVLRIHDIVYRLHLRPAQVDVFLFHGNMQIDEFSAIYHWAGGDLEFLDAAKATRYQLRLGTRVPPLPGEPASAPGTE